MISLLITVVVVVFIFWVAIWGLGTLAPGHPAMIDNVLWVVCVLIILLLLARAFGVVDVPIPQVR